MLVTAVPHRNVNATFELEVKGAPAGGTITKKPTGRGCPRVRVLKVREVEMKLGRLGMCCKLPQRALPATQCLEYLARAKNADGNT